MVIYIYFNFANSLSNRHLYIILPFRENLPHVITASEIILGNNFLFNFPLMLHFMPFILSTLNLLNSSRRLRINQISCFHLAAYGYQKTVISVARSILSSKLHESILRLSLRPHLPLHLTETCQ